MTTTHEFRETILEVKGVTRVLGGRTILRELDLQIRDVVRPGSVTGQVVALLGPSGIGKTTLFRILAGLDTPDAGTVTVGVERTPVERGMVGVVFQNYPLFEHRTVLGNLVLAARQTGMSKREATMRSMDFLKRFGLGEHGDKYPAQLSGGQRQRVSIAQQFLCSRHFVLMDEPFSGLDPIAVDSVSELVTEMANMHEMNTIVVVTHNVEAGLEIADTALLVGRDRDEEGRVIPGARIKRTYDLIERGLAWRPGIDTAVEFHDLLREVRAAFREM